MGDFVDSVLKEAERQKFLIQEPLLTVYFGGGTPTALSETHLYRLIRGLQDRLPMGESIEFTCEANPRTVTRNKAMMMRECGVNRVSLGIQAWDPATLKTLGRDHEPDDALETYQTLQQAGFENLNLDLMFSIPGQSMEQWQHTLDLTMRLQPQHISAYNLNYEEDTDFFQRLKRGQYQVDEERDASFFFHAHDQLEAAGYEHYEISNYAQPGHLSVHNAAYWMGYDYLGLGPGAWSTIHYQRWQNMPDTLGYIKAIADNKSTALPAESLTEADLRTERFGLELRTRHGLDRGMIRPSEDTLLVTLIKDGLIEESQGRLRLTRVGMPLVDSIAVALLGGDA
jgi:oxygen-independent coproporphyrinogen-3 oxidase